MSKPLSPVQPIKARPTCNGESRRASWRVSGLLWSGRSTAFPALTVASGCKSCRHWRSPSRHRRHWPRLASDAASVSGRVGRMPVARRCGRAYPRSAGRYRCQRSPRHPSGWKLTARCRSSSASSCQKKRGSLVRPANRTKGGAALLPPGGSFHYSPRNPGSFLESLSRAGFAPTCKPGFVGVNTRCIFSP